MNNDATFKVDLHNIPEALTILRAELKRQQEMESKATPGPWQAYDGELTGFIPYLDVVIDKDTDPGDVAHFDDANNSVLACLARNLNPARLKVAEELCAMADWEMNDLAGSHDPAEAHHFLKLAAALLGVEVVE